MRGTDRLPLTEGPAAERIQRLVNNRLGAVYSALYSFWSSRHIAPTAGKRILGVQRRLDTVYSALHNLSLWSGRNSGQEPTFTRRDSYSIILFDGSPKTILANDVTSSPDQLLDIVLREQTGAGTDFASALYEAEDIMESSWSIERFVA
jgi:hypothetical protein